MTEEDTNKVTLALANSFLQGVTLQQTLMIVQEKSLERAKEEVAGMEDEALQEVLTNLRAQEIARDLRAETLEETLEETSEETPEGEAEKVSSEETKTAE
jgi:Glu-tRNA(Gln) amidotransferase subunit E-like FAD-binding protein